MHYLPVFAVMLGILLPAVTSMALQSTEPHHWMAFDNMDTRTDLDVDAFLDENDITLDARTPIKVCESMFEWPQCSHIDYGKEIARSLAAIIKGKSDDRDCTELSAAVGSFKFKYYTTGRNCDTTAQEKTIAGAIYKYFRSIHFNMCGTACLRMSHGGTWNGWLRLGGYNNINDMYNCNDGLNFGDCVSGGNNDI
ncbi:hypothetical protein BJX76DRAFT_362885 [Aspergillus varians]